MQLISKVLSGSRSDITSFGIYFSTSILNKLLPFLLLPIVTAYLTPEEYGVWAIYQVLLTFAVPVVGMNMQNNITRNFFRQEQSEIAQIAGHVLLVLAVNVSIGLGVVAAYVGVSGGLVTIDSGWLYLVVVVAAANVMFQLDLTVLRNQKRALSYGLLQICNTVLNFAVTVILIILYGYGWEGQALGFIIAALAFGSLGIGHLWMRGYVALTFDIHILREILAISLPLVPHALASVIITMSDRLFIESMLGTETVGIYSVGYQFGMVLLLVANAFNLVWGPWMYERLSDLTVARQRQIVMFTYIYYAAMILLAILTTIGSMAVIHFFINEAYAGAEVYVLWVSLGYTARAMYTMVFPFLVFTGKTNFLAVASGIAAVVNLLGNCLLISINGAVGAAQSTLISYVLWFLMIWWYAQRIYPMPWGLQWLFRKEGT